MTRTRVQSSTSCLRALHRRVLGPCWNARRPSLYSRRSKATTTPLSPTRHLLPRGGRRSSDRGRGGRSRDCLPARDGARRALKRLRADAHICRRPGPRTPHQLRQSKQRATAATRTPRARTNRNERASPSCPLSSSRGEHCSREVCERPSEASRAQDARREERNVARVLRRENGG